MSVATLKRNADDSRLAGVSLSSSTDSRPLVSVIVVHHRQPRALARMVASLSRQAVATEVLVVNASPEVSLRGLPRGCRVITVENIGYAGAVNAALAHARGETVAICNADVVLPAGGLSLAVEHLQENDDVGVVAPRLVNEDGSSQHSARRFYTWPAVLWARFPLRGRLGPPGFFKRYLMMGDPRDSARDVDWAIGAMLVVRRSALEDPASVFDPRYRFYMEDVDFCLDMWKRGWRVVQLSQLVVEHSHTRASSKVFSRAGFHHLVSFLKFLAKHRGLPQRAR